MIPKRSVILGNHGLFQGFLGLLYMGLWVCLKIGDHLFTPPVFDEDTTYLELRAFDFEI